jgi:NitT/TauT family transport system permease protein
MTGSRLLRGAAGTAGLLLVAEAAGRSGLVDQALLPPVSTVLARAAGLVADPAFLADAGNSLTSWITGLLLTVALAVPAGLVLGGVPGAEPAVRPLIEFLRPIPSVALIPLAILLFPEQLQMRVAVVVYAACWPVLVNTLYGLRDVDPVARDTLRGFGFGPLSVLLRVSLPSAAPFIATGVRLAASVAIVLVVSSELVAGGIGGIGVFINQAASGGRTDLMIAATVWTGLFGLAVNALLVRAERRLFRWHHMTTGQAA